MGSSSEREQVTALGQFAHMYYAPETANGSLVPCTFGLQSVCTYFVRTLSGPGTKGLC